MRLLQYAVAILLCLFFLLPDVLSPALGWENGAMLVPLSQQLGSGEKVVSKVMASTSQQHFARPQSSIRQQASTELVVQNQHRGPIYSLAYSPDGRLMASGSWDTTVKLWDVSTRKQLRTLAGHTLFVNAVSFSPDGTLLASGSSDLTVCLWSVATGQVKTLFDEHYTKAILCLAFSPSGKLLATGGEGGEILIWDVIHASLVRRLRTSRHGRDVNCITFSQDEDTLLTGSGGPDRNGGEVKFWSLASGEVTATLGGQRNKVSTLALSPGGRLLARGSWDGTIKLHDMTSHRDLATLQAQKKGVTCLAFSPDGDYLAAAGLDKTIMLWDVKSRRFRGHLQGHSQQVRALAFNPLNGLLATGGWDRTIRLWDVRSRSATDSFAHSDSSVQCSTWSRDGTMIASASNDNLIRVWDAATWRSIRTFSQHSISCLAFAPDNQMLASGSSDKTICLWDPHQGKLLRVLQGHSLEIQAVAFHPHSRLLASAAGNTESGEIILWNVASGQKVSLPETHRNEITSLSFNQQGNLLASASWDGTVQLWDVAKRQLLRIINHDNYVQAVAFSPDGKTLASGGWDHKIRLWNVMDGKAVRTLEDHTENVNALAFSSDGSILASGSTDKTVKLWNYHTGVLLRTLSGHTEDVRSVCFDPGGQKLLSSGWDGIVNLWKATSGEKVIAFIGVGRTGFVTVTPDNYYTATRQGLRSVAFRKGTNIYPFEQFDLRLNRPDIVLQRLGSPSKTLIAAYRQAYEKRLKRLGLSEKTSGQDLHLPSLEIVRTELAVSMTQPRISFRIRAADVSSPLHRVNIWINGVPASGTIGNSYFTGSQGLNLRPSRVFAFQGTVTVRLSRGINYIQVSCLNSGGTESMRPSFSVNYVPPTKTAKPDLFVVAVGVSRYRQRENNLDYASKDAQDLASALGKASRSYAGGSYANVHILTLTDQQAKHDVILKSANRLLEKSGVDDTVVLFLAGHGILDKQLNYYFGTYDMDFSLPQTKGLSYDEITGLLDKIQPRKKLLLMDSCFSGEVDKESTLAALTKNIPSKIMARASHKTPRAELGRTYVGLNNSFQLMQELFADLRRGNGASVIAAASGIQYAYEGDGNGLFTHAVLTGLRHHRADKNQNGQVEISELRTWVWTLVQQMSRGKQTPTVRQDNVENDWELL